MGAWGTYPKDSDGALDLLSIIGKEINNKLEEIYKKESGYCYAGLIMLLLQKGFFIKAKYVEKAISNMEVELKMAIEGNVHGWRDVEKAIKDIRYVIDEFNKLVMPDKILVLSTNKLYGKDISKKTANARLQIFRNHEIHAPRNWLARSHELEFGTSWSGMMELNSDEPDPELEKAEDN